MTWPFENDTSAITNKLAKRSRKADKRSKAFLLLTIALSVCMIFSIILISAGAQEEFKNTQCSKAQIAILGITDDQLSSLRQNTARARISARPILSRMLCCMKLFCEICGKQSPMFQSMKRSSFRTLPRAICGTEMQSFFGSVKRWQRQTRGLPSLTALSPDCMRTT